MSGNTPEPVGKIDDDGNWKKTVWIPQVDDESAKRIERLKRDLDLEKRASTDGHQNLPTSTDEELSAIQMEVCNRVFSGILLLNEFLAEQVGLAVKRARPLMPPKLDLPHIKGQIGTAIEGIFSEHRKDLINARRIELERQRDLKLFRYENSLTRGAEYKESVVKVVAIIVVLFLFESIINGSLFSQVVSDGFIGGAILAGFISAINIVTGVAAGFYGWRYLGHKSPTMKYLIGLPVMLVCHGIALFWNVLIAHFREVSEALASNTDFNFDPAVLTRDTLAHMHTNGFFGVASVQSLGLLFLGLFIHLYSAKEGWDDLSDRYPDYKKKDLRVTIARENYEDALADVRDEGRDAIEAIEKLFKDNTTRTRTCYEITSEMLALAAQRKQEVRNSEDKWVADGNQLLKTYREVNLQIRDEGTAPFYFSSYPSASDYRRRSYAKSVPPSVEILEQERLADSGIEAIVQLRDEAKQTLDESESALKDVHRQVIAAIRSLDEQIDAESKKITREAEKELRRRDDLSPPQGQVRNSETLPANDAA